MDKKGFEIGKLATFILVTVAVVLVVSFFTGGFGGIKKIYGAVFERTNQSVGEVLKSWEELTPGEREKLSDERKAELLLKSAKESLDSGIAQQNVDDLKKAKDYADQILALTNVNDRQRTGAKTIAETAQRYITELSVANLLAQAAYQTNRDELANIYERCIRDFGGHIGSVECIARLFLLQHADKKGDAFRDAVNQDFGTKLAAAQSAQERARLLLAQGAIFESAATNDPEHAKDHLQDAISKYALLPLSGEFRSLPDYIGRAYHKKAGIYLRLPRLLGLTDEEGKQHALLEYENLFRQLGATEFLDRRKAEDTYRQLGVFAVTLRMEGYGWDYEEPVAFAAESDEKEKLLRLVYSELPLTLTFSATKEKMPQGRSFTFISLSSERSPRFHIEIRDSTNTNILCRDTLVVSKYAPSPLPADQTPVHPIGTLQQPFSIISSSPCRAFFDLLFIGGKRTMVINDEEYLQLKIDRSAPVKS